MEIWGEEPRPGNKDQGKQLRASESGYIVSSLRGERGVQMLGAENEAYGKRSLYAT